MDSVTNYHWKEEACDLQEAQREEKSSGKGLIFFFRLRRRANKGQTVTACKDTHLHNKWKSSPRSVTSATHKSFPSLTSFSPVYQIKEVENHPVFNETVKS